MNPTCPRSNPGNPHYMRANSDGTWYCPIERSAELSEAYRAEVEHERASEVATRLLTENFGAEDIAGLYVTLTRDEMLMALTDAVKAGMAL